LIITCYGGAFASAPAYISDLFGTRQVSAILGYLLTAWAVAGIVGPLLVSWVRDTTGSYTKTLYLFGSLFIVALILSLLMILNIRQHRSRRIEIPQTEPTL
jgi:OFA family oxalate/formate antiporter-like MFS transporter